MKKVLIFIVAYNAESHIENVLDRIPEDLSRDYDLEVLIIDDASKDKTTLISNLYSLRHKKKIKVLRNPKNQGYGGNQKIGYRYAIDNGFEVVALLHGDGQYNPKCLPDLIKPIVSGETDVVFGSRMINKKDAIKGGMPLYKFVGNIILTRIQNFFMKSGLSEFHSGYRIYSTKALRKIPFECNSNDFDFDTDIIIQLMDNDLKIKEIPIPTFYGDEISYVNGTKYALQILRTTFLSRLQKLGIFYHPKFDYEQDYTHYPSKIDFDSSHRFAMDNIKESSLVIDFCSGNGTVAKQLAAKKCRVVGVDKKISLDTKDCFIKTIEEDIDNLDFSQLREYRKADYVLLLDVLEHLKSPEILLKKIRETFDKNNTKVIITTGNIGFFAERFSLLFGNFNYKKRGILDLTHIRLFTFSSIEKMLVNFRFDVLDVEGLPAPFPLIIKNNLLAQMMIKLNNLLIWMMPGLFSYQVAIIAIPEPTLQSLLEDAIEVGGKEFEQAVKLNNP